MTRKGIHLYIIVMLLFAVSTFAAPVPDTGVTKCYDADGKVITCPLPGETFYGQDGNYSINSQVFTKLDNSGKVLPENATSWAMIRDHVTGLTWENKTDDGTIHDKDNKYTWYDSNPATNGGNSGISGNGTDTQNFIKTLNDTHFGGYTDWRIPTIKELTYTLNYSQPYYNLNIDTWYFPYSDSYYYWSSTTCTNNTSSAWGVSFSGGYLSNLSKSSSLSVRAVCGEQSVSFYTDNGDGTVTDTTTGLMWQQMWQQTSPNIASTWSQALSYCENLTLGGHTDWRLPTIKELRSLVDYSQGSPAISLVYFPNTLSDACWSSTTNSGSSTDEARGVSFGNGEDTNHDKSGSYYVYVRAVRGGQSESLGNLVISPLSRDVTNDLGATAFSVSNTGTGTMYWSAAVTSNIGWLRITSGSSGTDSGDINCAFDANSGASSRTATIRVTASGSVDSTKDVTVKQAAPTATPKPSPTPTATPKPSPTPTPSATPKASPTPTPSAKTPVPDTGQTKCYDVAGNEITCPSPGQALYGQDANYSINQMSYTKLDGSGNALPDSAMSWAMVKDNVTGLIWEMKTNMDEKKDYSNPHDADNTYTWYDSNPATNGGKAGTPGWDTEDFIRTLNDTSYGGYNDWRMPNIRELAYIVNYNIPSPGPVITPEYFPNTVDLWYWSSTTEATDTEYARLMVFGTGYDDGSSKSESRYARAVRVGQPMSLDYSVVGLFDTTMGSGLSDDASATIGEYTDNGDGTVTDAYTNLMWQQAVPSDDLTWEQALSYCADLALAGYTDWRLPTINELRSLVDYCRHSPSINTTYFPNTAASFYWSSTTEASYTDSAWGVDFYDNHCGSEDKSNFSHYVRAVRAGQPVPLDHSVISVNPPGRSVAKDAGSTTFSVTNTGTGTMPWTATVTTGGSWLSITSGASGSNSGTIPCSFAATTTTSARTATIRVTASGATGSPVDVTVTQAGIAKFSPVPDTGQTKCYNNTAELSCPFPGQPFYGQDANYRINPMSYTKLDANGNALPDSATSWVMVKDNVTGLIWEMKTNKDGVKNNNNPHDADNTFCWYDSNPDTNGGYAGYLGDGTNTDVFIKVLNDAHFGGYSDWRLPTIKELSDIINYSISDPGPTIDTSYFPNTAASFYWSSTTFEYPYGDSFAWGVNFGSGDGFEDSKGVWGSVRAVCGGQAASDAYIDNGDGTVTDTSTGLMWQQDGSRRVNWEYALSDFEGMNLGGYTDWRLPTIKELRSLINYGISCPSINIKYFSNTVSSFYWSSTTSERYAGDARGVEFCHGYDNFSDKDFGGSTNHTGSQYVRAVRGGQTHPPTPDIKANRLDGPITFPSSNPVSITASLAPGDKNEQSADWWLAYSSPWGWYSLTSSGWNPGINPLATYPLFNIDPVEIFNGYLPAGDYTFYFAVDLSPDGILDEPIYYDGVQVHVTQ